ncbi:tetratricopeptide repeat domain containing protein, partial [Acanthamoeba castellanii str. Neff]
EAGVTVLAVNALWDLLHNCRFLDLVTQRPADVDSRRWYHFLFRLSVLSACFTFFTLHRAFFVGSFSGMVPNMAYNPLVDTSDPMTILLSASYLHFRSLYLLFVPTSLSFDYSFNCIPLVEAVSDPRNLWSLLTYSGLAYFLAWSVWQWPHRFFRAQSGDVDSDSDSDDNSREMLVMLFGLFAVPFFSTSGTLMAESALYVPSVGFCMLVGYLLHRGHENKVYSTRVFVCLCLAILLFFSATTYLRNPVWDSEAALYQSGVESCPASVRILHSHALELEKAGQTAQSAEYFRRALELDPTDLTSLARLGKQAFIRANTTEALAYYGGIINREPKIYHEYAYLDVGLIYWKGGVKQKAYNFLDHAVKLYNDPSYASLRTNLPTPARPRAVW